MSQSSSIEWTDTTWNPVRGCSMAKGSELGGCLNCYAARLSARNLPGHRSPTSGEAFAIVTDKGPRWTGKVELIESKLYEPLHWRKPRQVFVNSMSDLFHESLPYESIDRVFAVMEVTPHITYQVLTKRAGRMREYMENRWRRAGSLLKEQGRRPLDNVWLGVSVENQPMADERIVELLRTLAAVRFVSYEPALEAVDFMDMEGDGSLNALTGWRCGRTGRVKIPQELRGLDWIIIGGESGPMAREFNLEWARSTIRQCKAAGVPVFVKQLGSNPVFGPEGTYSEAEFYSQDSKGADWDEWPDDLKVREFPKVGG